MVNSPATTTMNSVPGSVMERRLGFDLVSGQLLTAVIGNQDDRAINDDSRKLRFYLV